MNPKFWILVIAASDEIVDLFDILFISIGDVQNLTFGGRDQLYPTKAYLVI